MRDDEVARAGGLPDAARPNPKELDRRIDIVAADSARAPDSHVRRQLLVRLIRYLWRAMPAPSQSDRGKSKRGAYRLPSRRISVNAARWTRYAPFRKAHMANWRRAQRSRVLPYEAAPPRGRGREVLAPIWKISPADSVGGLRCCRRASWTNPVQHDSRRAAVPNCTRRAD